MFTIDCCVGMMPNQAWGTLNGRPFYFRARHGLWRLEVGYEMTGKPHFGSSVFSDDGIDGETVLSGGTEGQNNLSAPDGWWSDGLVEAWLRGVLMASETMPPSRLFKNYPGSITCTT